jgi:hypothetical protein
LADLVGASGTTLEWETHSESDVAILRLQSQGNVWNKINTRFIPLDWIEPRLGAPIRERIVTVMGFPLQLGTKGYFSPSTSEAKTLSGLQTLYSPTIKREAIFYTLDKPSLGGFSGGPAILLPTPYSKDGKFIMFGANPTPLLVGLVHGLISGKSGNGFTMIVPSKFIVDVILKAEGKKGSSKNP